MSEVISKAEKEITIGSNPEEDDPFIEESGTAKDSDIGTVPIDDDDVPEPEIDELDSDHHFELMTWMIKKPEIVPSLASAYATLFIQNGLGSFNRIAKKISRVPDYMVKIGIKPDDAEEIAIVMHKEGFIAEVPASFAPAGNLTISTQNSHDDHFDDNSSPNSPVRQLSRVPPAQPKSPVKKRTQEDIEHCEKEKEDINAVLLSLKKAVGLFTLSSACWDTVEGVAAKW
jgi:hypothetical protein